MELFVCVYVAAVHLFAYLSEPAEASIYPSSDRKSALCSLELLLFF